MKSRRAVLKAEIDALPADQRLVESGRFHVYCARAGQIPWVLQEIGRLRELTFRAVGEGTGKRSDIDLFDAYYLHLFVWDAQARGDRRRLPAWPRRRDSRAPWQARPVYPFAVQVPDPDAGHAEPGDRAWPLVRACRISAQLRADAVALARHCPIRRVLSAVCGPVRTGQHQQTAMRRRPAGSWSTTCPPTAPRPDLASQVKAAAAVS